MHEPGNFVGDGDEMILKGVEPSHCVVGRVMISFQNSRFELLLFQHRLVAKQVVPHVHSAVARLPIDAQGHLQVMLGQIIGISGSYQAMADSTTGMIVNRRYMRQMLDPILSIG